MRGPASSMTSTRSTCSHSGACRGYSQIKGSLVEHELAGAIPPHQVVRSALGAPDEEGAQLVMAVEHAAGLIQDAWHQRAFQRGVWKVQLQQSFDVMRSGPPVPFVMHELGICSGRHRGSVGHPATLAPQKFGRRRSVLHDHRVRRKPIGGEFAGLTAGAGDRMAPWLVSSRRAGPGGGRGRVG